MTLGIFLPVTLQASRSYSKSLTRTYTFSLSYFTQSFILSLSLFPQSFSVCLTWKNEIKTLLEHLEQEIPLNGSVFIADTSVFNVYIFAAAYVGSRSWYIDLLKLCFNDTLL